MRIAILGTGTVGTTLAARLLELGHQVRVGTRDPAATLAAGSQAPIKALVAEHPLAVVTFAEAAAQSEFIINASAGVATLDVLMLAGQENLAHKPLLDVSNPLDFSGGFPPHLFVKDTDSLGEQIQAAFPDALVVKSLNTVTAELMVRPEGAAKGGHTMFMAGNHGGAKEMVQELLEGFGYTDIIDLGGITSARGMEMMLPMWLQIMGALDTPMFGFKVAR